MHYPQSAHDELERLDREKCALLDSHKAMLRTCPEMTDADRVAALAEFEATIDNIFYDKRAPHEAEIEAYDTHIMFVQQRADYMEAMR